MNSEPELFLDDYDKSYIYQKKRKNYRGGKYNVSKR